MFFLVYLRRELQHRLRQGIVIATGLGLGIGLVIAVTALSSGVRLAQGKVLGALYGIGTDITVTTPVQPIGGFGGGNGGGAAGFGGFTPEPYVQHSDILSSPTQGTFSTSAVAAIKRLHDVAAASGGLTLTEIKMTIPADNAPPASFQPPVQLSVVGAQLGRGALGPLSAARLSSGREFTAADARADVAVLDSDYAAAHRLAVDSVITVASKPFTVIGIVTQPQGSSPPVIYIPLSRAQALAKLGGKVNTVYVEADSASAVGSVSREISRLMPSATVTNSSSLAKGVAGSLATTSKLAATLGTWLAVLALLAAFAVASLLTLAAVGRRAREFGTLKALGWRSGRISIQVMGETIAMGIAGAALGVAIGFTAALLASHAAPRLTAIVQTSNTGKGGFGGSLAQGGGIFHGVVGGPVQTFANPNATHAVPVPFSAPVSEGAIAIAVALALGGALVAGSFGGWQVTRLRPAQALASVG
jgi:putative ABC transport system permease protein